MYFSIIGPIIYLPDTYCASLKTSPNSFLCSPFRTRHEALQKLAIFFQHNKDEFGDFPDSGEATPTTYSTLLSINSIITSS